MNNIHFNGSQKFKNLLSGKKHYRVELAVGTPARNRYTRHWTRTATEAVAYGRRVAERYERMFGNA